MARHKRGEYRKKSQHALHTEIWLEKSGEKPTDEEILETYETIKETHRVPRGWKIAAINWNHSGSGTRGWQTGNVRDLFVNMELALDALEENFRIGRVRKNKAGVWEIHIAMEY